MLLPPSHPQSDRLPLLLLNVVLFWGNLPGGGILQVPFTSRDSGKFNQHIWQTRKTITISLICIVR